MDEVYDSLIIGSGAGGLTAAICLAKSGQKVLVLEQHYVPGGWCHSFVLNGQKFSPGVHYIGQLENGEFTNRIYKALGLAGELMFFKMRDDEFEHCRIGGLKFDYSCDPKKFQQELIKLYPEEEAGIRRYLKMMWKHKKQVKTGRKFRI